VPEQATIENPDGTSRGGTGEDLPARGDAAPPAAEGPHYRPASTLGWRRADAPWVVRLLWIWLLAVCVLLLALGRHLKPDPRGLGTHEQLGLPPCGFYLATGLPCPTCGVTTAYVAAVHGEVWQAIKIQPVGAIAALATASLVVLSLAGVATAGVPVVRLSPRGAVVVTLLVMGVFVGSWLYKLAVTLAAR